MSKALYFKDFDNLFINEFHFDDYSSYHFSTIDLSFVNKRIYIRINTNFTSWSYLRKFVTHCINCNCRVILICPIRSDLSYYRYLLRVADYNIYIKGCSLSKRPYIVLGFNIDLEFPWGVWEFTPKHFYNSLLLYGYINAWIDDDFYDFNYREGIFE